MAKNRGTSTAWPNDLAKRRIALRYWLLGREWHTALRALDHAERYHQGTRKDGVTPEFAHQIAVASYTRTLVGHLRFPEETLTAAFLHDLREDYGVSHKEIENRYGTTVAVAVDALTKEFRGAKRPTDQVFDQIASDPVASIVKGADRAHNQSTMVGVFSPKKILEYVEETEEYVFPMLREARNLHPDQEPAYENIKFVLSNQVAMARSIADSK